MRERERERKREREGKRERERKRERDRKREREREREREFQKRWFPPKLQLYKQMKPFVVVLLEIRSGELGVWRIVSLFILNFSRGMRDLCMSSGLLH
jgi:hypothetical protein